MPRADLLALDADTLALLANRGIVKRAQAEVDSGEFTCSIEDIDGAVTVTWSDDVECVIPAGKSPADGRCTCPATSLCRHLVRSVLAYQRQSVSAQPEPSAAITVPAATSPESTEAPTVASAEPPQVPETQDDEEAEEGSKSWDPGAFTDEELEKQFRKTDLARARRQFDEGQVVELVRGAKPSAYFHTLCLNIRFLVAGNLAYTHCDCAEPRPCSHVPLAVLAFRLLLAEREGGLVSTRRETLPVPTELLTEVEQALAQLALSGIQGAPRTLADRLRRLEERCRSEGLVWPAEVLVELVQQHEAYASHDARFSPRRVAELAGELCIRLDAIRADTGAVPQLFIRGSKTDRTVDVGKSQMVGMGCGARLGRGGVELCVYLQDDRSGAIVAVSKEFADPTPESGEAPRELWQIARTPAITGIPFANLGSGTLQVEGGKRAPSGRFTAGRSRANLNPHTFQWEKNLRPPVLSEDFAELAARLAAQPPMSLRPRRVGSRLHACSVAAVEGAGFSERDQTFYAAVQDRQGNTALVAHPYLSRCHHGADRLVHHFETHPQGLRFVTGDVSLGPLGAVIRPVSLVFEVDGTRTLIQPWIDGPASVAGEPAPDRAALEGSLDHADSDPVGQYPSELLEAAGEQWLLGLQRADSHVTKSWRQVVDRGGALGFNRLIRPAQRLLETLEQRSSLVKWDPEPAVVELLRVSAHAVLASENSGG